MESMRDAVLQMVVQDSLLDLVQRSTDRPDLVQYVDAVAVVFDHARDPSHLAFDPPQPRKLRFLDRFIHDLNYTPVGYTSQA